jgi:hypothetical protein
MILRHGSELRDGALVRGWARWWGGEYCGVGEVFGEVAGDLGEGLELGIDGGFLMQDEAGGGLAAAEVEGSPAEFI